MNLFAHTLKLIKSIEKCLFFLRLFQLRTRTKNIGQEKIIQKINIFSFYLRVINFFFLIFNFEYKIFEFLNSVWQQENADNDYVRYNNETK